MRQCPAGDDRRPAHETERDQRHVLADLDLLRRRDEALVERGHARIELRRGVLVPFGHLLQGVDAGFTDRGLFVMDGSRRSSHR